MPSFTITQNVLNGSCMLVLGDYKHFKQHNCIILIVRAMISDKESEMLSRNKWFDSTTQNYRLACPSGLIVKFPHNKVVPLLHHFHKLYPKIVFISERCQIIPYFLNFTLCYLLVEEHWQHHFTGFVWKVGKEQDLIRRLLRYRGCWA